MGEQQELIMFQLNETSKKLDKIFQYIDDIKNDVGSIKIQTTKTNGRVTAIEKQELLVLIKSVAETASGNKSEIHDLKQTHDNCPINEIKEQTKTLRLLAENPKLLKSMFIGFAVSFVISCSISIAALYKVYDLFGNINKGVKIENTIKK